MLEARSLQVLAVEQKLMAMQPRSVADLAAVNERVSQLLTAIETLSESTQ